MVFLDHIKTCLEEFSEVPYQNKNGSWHKTDCCNEESDFLLEVHSAIHQQFPQWYTCNLPVLALLSINLEKTLLRIQGGLHLQLRSFYKAYKKRITVLLNKKHSV